MFMSASIRKRDAAVLHYMADRCHVHVLSITKRGFKLFKTGVSSGISSMMSHPLILRWGCKLGTSAMFLGSEHWLSSSHAVISIGFARSKQFALVSEGSTITVFDQ